MFEIKFRMTIALILLFTFKVSFIPAVLSVLFLVLGEILTALTFLQLVLKHKIISPLCINQFHKLPHWGGAQDPHMLAFLMPLLEKKMADIL